MRFTIIVILTLTSFVAILLAGWRTFGMRGVALSCAVVAFAWFALLRAKTPTFYPFNRQRMTVVHHLCYLCKPTNCTPIFDQLQQVFSANHF